MSGSVSESSNRWASGFANPDLRSHSRIRKPLRLLKKLQVLANRDDVELWSLDECHFQQHGTRCRMWIAPEEKDPVVIHASTRKSIACFGAVSLHSGKFIYAISAIFNAVTFEAFLKQLLRHRSRNKTMVVILDNARYHHAKLLKPLLEKHQAHLELLFLPPYSPQLAPIERVWKLARRLATHNQYFANLQDVQVAIASCFNQWRQPNAVLRRLCGIT